MDMLKIVFKIVCSLHISLMGEMVEIHLKDELVSGETTPDQRAVRMAEIGHLLRAYLK